MRIKLIKNGAASTTAAAGQLRISCRDHIRWYTLPPAKWRGLPTDTVLQVLINRYYRYSKSARSVFGFSLRIEHWQATNLSATSAANSLSTCWQTASSIKPLIDEDRTRGLTLAVALLNIRSQSYSASQVGARLWSIQRAGSPPTVASVTLL